MLTNGHIDALCKQDTRKLADVLMTAQVLGTEVGDQVFAALGNYPERFDALRSYLQERGAWEVAA
jgi:hypothetical protein